MLARLAAGEGRAIAAAVAAARDAGTFMTLAMPDPRRHPPGMLFRRNRSSRGLALPPLRAVTAELRLPQGAEARGNDWHLPTASLASFDPSDETRRVGICLGEMVFRPLG
jgi:hypothetical protein